MLSFTEEYEHKVKMAQEVIMANTKLRVKTPLKINFR
jgi:hypothetical protein